MQHGHTFPLCHFKMRDVTCRSAGTEIRLYSVVKALSKQILQGEKDILYFVDSGSERSGPHHLQSYSTSPLAWQHDYQALISARVISHNHNSRNNTFSYNLIVSYTCLEGYPICSAGANKIKRLFHFC